MEEQGSRFALPSRYVTEACLSTAQLITKQLFSELQNPDWIPKLAQLVWKCLRLDPRMKQWIHASTEHKLKPEINEEKGVEIQDREHECACLLGREGATGIQEIVQIFTGLMGPWTVHSLYMPVHPPVKITIDCSKVLYFLLSPELGQHFICICQAGRWSSYFATPNIRRYNLFFFPWWAVSDLLSE